MQGFEWHGCQKEEGISLDDSRKCIPILCSWITTGRSVKHLFWVLKTEDRESKAVTWCCIRYCLQQDPGSYSAQCWELGTRSKAETNRNFSMDTSRVWIQALEDQHAWPDPEETVAVWMGNMSLTWSRVGTDFSGRMSQESFSSICKRTWCCEKELSKCAIHKDPRGSSDGPKKSLWLPWSALEHSGCHCKTRCLK